MTINTNSFIFDGRKINGPSEHLLTGGFLNAGENLLMMGFPGMGKMELCRIICRNADKAWMDTVSSHTGMRTPPGLSQFMIEAENLIIGGFPDDCLKRVIIERSKLGRSTLVAVTAVADYDLLAEKFFTAIMANKNDKWHKIVVSPVR